MNTIRLLGDPSPDEIAALVVLLCHEQAEPPDPIWVWGEQRRAALAQTSTRRRAQPTPLSRRPARPGRGQIGATA
ncbi:MAG: hypothetical protein JWO63_930 [Frankiales bacterium]|nr:hypothetical protein [Frankiales bacterium]